METTLRRLPCYYTEPGVLPHRGGCGECPPSTMIGVHLRELGDEIIRNLRIQRMVDWLAKR